jgi:uncharacterized protein involved in exopolysaccharide biosynthesis
LRTHHSNPRIGAAARSGSPAAAAPGSESAVRYLASRYFIQAVGRSRLIEIGYRSLYPEVASILANTLLITYLEKQRGDNGRRRKRHAAGHHKLFWRYA